MSSKKAKEGTRLLAATHSEWKGRIRNYNQGLGVQNTERGCPALCAWAKLLPGREEESEPAPPPSHAVAAATMGALTLMWAETGKKSTEGGGRQETPT